MTLTPDEYQALVTVLRRAPITPGEALALNAILVKLAPPTPPVPPQGDTTDD